MLPINPKKTQYRLGLSLAVQSLVLVAAVGATGWIAGTPAPPVTTLTELARSASEVRCSNAAVRLGATTSLRDGQLVVSLATGALKEAALASAYMQSACLGHLLTTACLGEGCLDSGPGLSLRFAPRPSTVHSN